MGEAEQWSQGHQTHWDRQSISSLLDFSPVVGESKKVCTLATVNT